MITVVSGVPRSGTSLMMQMLAAGGLEVLTDGSRLPDEDNPRGYFEYGPAKALATDRSWVELAEGKAIKVVHLLLRHLPAGNEYRVILMRRRMEEVLASQRRMLERQGKQVDDAREATLSEIFERQLMEVSDWMRKQQNWRVLDVSYNALMIDPDATAARVAEFIEPALAPRLMAATVVPGLYRERIERGS